MSHTLLIQTLFVRYLMFGGIAAWCGYYYYYYYYQLLDNCVVQPLVLANYHTKQQKHFFAYSDRHDNVFQVEITIQG